MAYDKTIFNRTPYYDDFDEDKKFLRMLFRPGYAVQARELTQAQTILQNQIQRFGDHIFEDGSRVLGGDVASQNAYFVRVQRKATDITEGAQIEINPDDWVNFEIAQNNEGVNTTARVLEVINPGGEFDDYYGFIIQFISGSEFGTGPIVTTNPAVQLHAYAAQSAQNPSDSTNISALQGGGIQGLAKVASVNSGIFYTNGYFVKNDFQTISPYTLDDLNRRNFTYPTSSVGFNIVRTVVTSTDDPTLRDPANGTYNYNAPGADRYKLNLKLSFSTQAGFDETSFIELITYSEGKVTKKSVYTEYAALEDTLARRTYDESGSYTVRPFELDTREHQDDGTNRGLYKEPIGKRSKAVAVMNPGKAYIFGYEFETQSPEYLTIDKARDSKHQIQIADAQTLPVELGPYVVGNVLGATNEIDGADGEAAILGFINLFTQQRGPDNGVEGKANVKFYYKEWDADDEHFGKFVYAGTANVIHIVKDDELWTDTNTYTPDEPQDRRWSSYFRFYLDDIDSTTPIDGVIGDLDRVCTQGEQLGEGSSLELESYMVFDDGNDAIPFSGVYNPEEFDPAQDTGGTPIWKRWVAGGKVVSFGDTDGDGESNYLNPWVQAHPEGDRKLLHRDTSPPTLLFEVNEGSLMKQVQRLSYTTQQLIDIPKESITEYDSISNSCTIDLTAQGLDQFKFHRGTINDPAGESSVSNDDKGKLYCLTVAGEAGDNNWASDNPGDPTPSFACPIDISSNGQYDFIVSASGKSLTIRGPKSTSSGIDRQVLDGDFNYVLLATLKTDDDQDGSFGTNIRRKILRTHSELIGGDTAGVPYDFSDQDGDEPWHSGGFPVRDGPIGSPNYYYELRHADVLRIKSIKTDGGQDLSNDFIFDNGQRDTEYSYARLYLKNQVKADYLANNSSQNGNRDPSNAQVFIVEYEYFDHDNEGPILPNSYVSSDYFSSSSEDGAYEDEVDSTTNLRFSQIPVFTSPITGNTVQLANCIDFRFTRPSKQGSGQNILRYRGGPAQQSFTPRSLLNYDELRVKHTYFLPRIDKVVITKRLSDDETNFDVIEGIPSLDPIAPDDREDSMTLYQLTVPPYTFNVDDIRIKYIENKRYTMRDIGRIEGRVGDLEYFTTLSDLESKAASATLVVDVQGESGTEEVIAYKNAILVDSFRGHGVGDVANNDYRCAIDFESGIMRPSFSSQALSLNGVTGDNSGITIDSNGIARISHGSTVSLIDQPYANTTIKANPFYLTNWMGTMNISPYGDYWWDVNYRPTIRVNTIGEADGWKSVTYENPVEAGKGFGSQWNDWQSMWHGIEYSSEDDTQLAVINAITTPRTSLRTQLLPKRFEDDDQSVSRTTETIAQKKVRVGVNIRSIPDRIKKILGNRIVDVSIVPFVRSRELTIDVENLKPNTNVYCFFDGVDVTELCTVNGLTAGTSGFRTGDGGNEPAGKIQKLKFNIPAGQYESGEKLFRVIDEPNNDVEFATTAAEATYYAQGLKLSRDSGAVSIRPPVLRRQTVSSERVVSNVFSRETVFDNNSNTQYIDPLAQTFTINGGDHPGGVFLDSVSCFFATKHATLPITLQIRPTVQGSPHASIIIPFSEVVKYPNDVNVNDLSIGPINKTLFEFKTPVFLEPGEYSLCFVCNTGDYELFLGELGELDIRTQRQITNATNVNNLYEPQNGSVSIESVNKDLMFTINQARYETTPKTVVLENGVLGGTADVDMVYLQAKHLDLTGADIRYDLTLDSFDGGSAYTTLLEANSNHAIDQRRQVRAAGHANVLVTFDPSNSDIAPMLDTSQSSLIAISNYIDNEYNQDTELEGEVNGSGGAEARYITRRVSLPAGTQSDPNALQVILSKAGTGHVDVYLKAVGGQNQLPFDEVPYIRLQEVDDGMAHEAAVNNTDFTYSELSWELPDDSPYDGENGFQIFAVKVCLRTDDPIHPPLIKDLRCIALTIPDIDG